MTEREWVKSICEDLEKELKIFNDNLRVNESKKLPYSSEVLEYKDDQPFRQNYLKYETDFLVYEVLDECLWKPRVIIEAKINSITTHDAITYSQKAQTHKNVHPYLRYGILIGNRKHHPLPGRLFRHGQHFDFMQSWKSYESDNSEWLQLIEILKSEIEASYALEEIIFNSRAKNRVKYTLLHRPLRLQ
ncbi:hypothetical protein [Aureibaculum conchae]|uniref:hypothetical protein n=1 Tax=Aureibaculum sp. 2308TA14-22 TaxID=3108392 RepID=UPI0033973E7A